MNEITTDKIKLQINNSDEEISVKIINKDNEEVNGFPVFTAIINHDGIESSIKFTQEEILNTNNNKQLNYILTRIILAFVYGEGISVTDLK